MATSSSSSKPVAQTFEFTKRKRWTETLFSEISETLLFVLSPTCRVLYCGPAIVELLGWKEDQLVDTDLGAFIEDEDQENFRWTFTESLRSGQDLFTYARFKYDRPPSTDSNPKPGLLFELKGHPHYVQGQQQPQCFFLSAMPYPSRNIAMLNTYLDLKIENEKLAQRLHDLKVSVEASSRALEHTPLPSQFATSPYPHRFNQPAGPLVPNHSSLYSRATPGLPFYPLSDSSGSGLHGAHRLSSLRIDDALSGLGGLGFPGDDDDDDGQKKKKLKRPLVSDEQRVCMICGRTDSPEWRKGPNGPKTLCNACGLRWAKRTRKSEPEPKSPSASHSKGRGSTLASEDSSMDLSGSQQLTYQS